MERLIKEIEVGCIEIFDTFEYPNGIPIGEVEEKFNEAVKQLREKGATHVRITGDEGEYEAWVQGYLVRPESDEEYGNRVAYEKAREEEFKRWDEEGRVLEQRKAMLRKLDELNEKNSAS